MAFIEELQIKITHASKTEAEATMPIVDKIRQPYGFVHGGATLSLLESVAGACVIQYVDFSRERPFGVGLSIRHVKSGESGMLRATATLDRIDGNKYYLTTTAYDDDGDVVSTGTFAYKVVSLERLRQKQEEYERKHASRNQKR